MRTQERDAVRLRMKWFRSEGRKDLLTAIGLLLFAVGGFVFINPTGARVFPGPGGITWRTMPFLYAGLLFALSVIYIVQSCIKIRGERQSAELETEVTDADRLIFWRRGATLGLLLIYVLLLRVFGFAIVTPVFLFLLFRLYQRGHWRADMGISLVGAATLWLLFVRTLRLNLDGDLFDPVTPFLLDSLRLVGL